jgi:hypothetical protein
MCDLKLQLSVWQMVVWTLKSQFSFQNSMFLNYNIYFFKTQLQIIHFLRFSLKSFFFFPTKSQYQTHTCSIDIAWGFVHRPPACVRMQVRTKPKDDVWHFNGQVRPPRRGILKMEPHVHWWTKLNIMNSYSHPGYLWDISPINKSFLFG